MAIERKIFAQGGMNSDSAPEYVTGNDYISGHNIRVSGLADGEEGDVTNIEGNTIISSTRPSGINKTIGGYGFELTRKAYTFLSNSNGFNLITEIDYDTLVEATIFENKTNSGGIDILPLDPQKYVTDCKLLQSRFLMFTYGTVPYYVDLNLLKNNTFASVVQEDLLLLKGQPLTEPTLVYNNDAGRSVNSLKDRLFQFRTQFEKQNYELTTWGTISKRIVPSDENTPTLGTNVTISNNIIVSVNIGSDRNKKINIAARYDMLDWFLVKSVDRADIIALTNTAVNVSLERYEAYNPTTNIYSFAFYNDENYENIDVLETDENYDHIWNAETLEILNGSILAIAGLNEGYARPIVDVDISVSSYDGGVTTIPPTYDFFKVLDGETTNERISGSHSRRVTVKFSGLPKTGDVVRVQVRDIRDYANTTTYSATVTPTQQDNLVAMVALVATSIPNCNVINDERTQIGFITQEYFELSVARVDLANAGTGASRSVHGVKSNSSYQLALAHYDGYGRYFPIVTDKRFVQKTPSYAQTHGLLSSFNWQINNLPPSDAKTYQWLLTTNLTHDTDLFINGRYDAALSTSDYLVFKINSLKKFNDTNSSSILNYEYSKGDRVTFLFTFANTSTPVKWFDTVAIDVEVVGFTITVDTTVTPNITTYLLKVRKSSALSVSDIVDKEVLLEVYSPKKRLIKGTSTPASTLFYEIGERYDIVGGDYAVKSGTIKGGDNYFKTRTLTDNATPNTAYNLVVEDFNFSDFYKSDYTSYGRPRSYYDENGNIDKPASIRYSDIFVTGSRNNAINRFYGARIYGDGAGETSSVDGFIKKIRMRGTTLVVIQELDVWHIPVNLSIVEDQIAQRQYAISDKLLNSVRPTQGRYGIGTAKESYAESSNGTIYFVDPNNSLPVRDGYDGLSVIAGNKEKFFRTVLKQSKKDKRKVIGWFDVFNNEYNISIEILSGVLTTFSFNNTNWVFEDNYTVAPNGFGISSVSNGTIVLNGDGTATFTPTNNYTGSAGFVFSFLNSSSAIVTKNTCISVVAGNTTVNPLYFIDLTGQEINTLLYSNSVLISGMNIPVAISIITGEYSINGGAFTSASGTVVSGNTVIVRRTSSASYEAMVYARLTVGSYFDDFNVTTKAAVISAATLSFLQYSAGSFNFTLNRAITSDIIITQAGVFGYNGDCIDGTHTNSDSMISMIVLAAGTVSGSVSGQTPMPSTVTYYKRKLDILINGTNYRNGDTFILNGITITIDNPSSCNPYSF